MFLNFLSCKSVWQKIKVTGTLWRWRSCLVFFQQKQVNSISNLNKAFNLKMQKEWFSYLLKLLPELWVLCIHHVLLLSPFIGTFSLHDLFIFFLTSLVDSPGWFSGGQETKNKLSFMPIAILVNFIYFRTALLFERRSQGLGQSQPQQPAGS